MLRHFLFVLVACAIPGTYARDGFAVEPYEVWLESLEGTWTWNDQDRGSVSLTLQLNVDGNCLLGTGKDESGTFVTVVGWEAGIKSLTETCFHSNGGSSRIVYSEVTVTTLRGLRQGSGAGGEPQPDSKVHVVRNGNTLTTTVTDSNGESRSNVLTTKTISDWINQYVAGISRPTGGSKGMPLNPQHSAMIASQKLEGFGSEAIPPLLESIETMDRTQGKARKALMRLLMRLGEADQDSAPIVVPKLVEILKTDEDEMMRRMAAYSISDIGRITKGGPHHPLVLTTLPVLVNALKTDTRFVRLAAASAIGQMAPPSKATIDALSEVLASDEDRDIRRFCVSALRHVGSDAAMPALLKAVENDADIMVRDGAMSAIQLLGLSGQDELPVFINVLKVEKRSSIRRSAIKAICGMGAKAKVAMPAIEEVLTADGDWQNREIAAEYLGKYGGRDQVPALIKGLKDKRPGAREECAGALGNIGSEAEDAIASLQEIYEQDSDPSLKQAAFAAIRKLQGNE